MSEETQAPEAGSDAYNQEMVDKYQNQTAEQGDAPDPLPVTPMPDDGLEKFYDPATGQYNWENHAKELAYRMQNPQAQEQQVEDKPADEAENQQAVNDIITQAGLQSEDLRTQLETNGELSEDAMVALERVGIPRDLVETYVENLNYRRDAQIGAALDYVGGEQAWKDMVDWGLQNLPESEINTYNDLLATDGWRIAADAIRVRMGDAAPKVGKEPTLVGGEQRSGGTFGYRSKSEMKQDMSNPKYETDPAFRQEVARKMQSASWDLE